MGRMAWVRTRHNSDGTTSYAVIYRHGGRQTSLTYTDEKAAARAAAAINAGLSPDELISPTPDASTLSVAEVVDRHVAQLTGVTDRTRHDYRIQARRHITPTLGGLPVASITRDHIATWVNALARKVSTKTLANLHGLLSAAMATAVESGWRTDNPCRGMRLPRSDDHERADMLIFTPEQYRRLHAALPAHWRPFVAFLVASGARFSEATALAVGQVEPDGSQVRIIRAHKRQPDSTFEVGPTKTRRSRRTVVMPDDYAPILADLVNSRRGDELVFTSPTGQQVRHSNFRNRVWVPAITAITVCPTHLAEHRVSRTPGLPEPCGCAGYMTRRARIHDLRHTSASWMINIGVSLPVIQRRLGHESITTTVDTYGHLLPDVQKTAAQAITTMWAIEPSPAE